MRQIVRLPSQLGAVIQTHRLGKGLTQTELARLAGTQQKTISAIENGSEGTKLDTLISVIAVLIGTEAVAVGIHDSNNLP